jgi:sulfur-carrier protein
MPRIVLASALARWMQPAPPGGAEIALQAGGATLDAALQDAFSHYPALRGYVVDEHGRLRHHVAVFIDGQVLRDKTALATPLAPDAEIYLLQALSGG